MSNSHIVDDVSQDTTTNDILLDITDEICNIPQINSTLQCEAVHKDPKKPKNKPTTSNSDETLLNIVSRPEDPDEQFMLSCVPILIKLTLRKNMIARMKIQNVLFDLAFEKNKYETQFESSKDCSVLSIPLSSSNPSSSSALTSENNSIFTSFNYRTERDDL
ncbi:hypothetical protein ABEB36_009260 [Hypothenemus hampei]|uniref:BESS domain-containing protein n=1 Tax=Hypothenemus hampei TaxID=57062 RepID=A0ABD1EG15_HYPHA